MTVPNPVTFLRAVGRALRAAWRGQPLRVTNDVVVARVQKCQEQDTCYDARFNQCRHCSCFVSLKANFATESCPRGLWKREFLKTS